jgi:hypothetical protein
MASNSTSNSNSNNSTSKKNKLTTPIHNLPFHCRFLNVELFGIRYQRNNKKFKIKNLRCFPSCGTVHRERGFCGRPVDFQLDIPNADECGIKVLAEFISSDEQSTTGLKIGQTVDPSTFPQFIRDEHDPTKPWMEGAITSRTGNSTIFTFNQSKKGWHYGWASNKHSCNSEHVLQAYVLEKISPSSPLLIVRGIFPSPAFMIFCRRRRRFALTPTAPIAPPKGPRVSMKAAAAAAAVAAAVAGEGDSEEEDGDSDTDNEIPPVSTTTTSTRKKRTSNNSTSTSKSNTGNVVVVVETPSDRSTNLTSENSNIVVPSSKRIRTISQQSTTSKKMTRSRTTTSPEHSTTTTTSTSTSTTTTNENDTKKRNTKRQRTHATTTTNQDNQNEIARFEATLRAVARHLAEVKPPAMTTTVSSPLSSSSSSIVPMDVEHEMNLVTFSNDLTSVLEIFDDIDNGSVFMYDSILDDDGWINPNLTTTTATSSSSSMNTNSINPPTQPSTKDIVITNLARFLLEEGQFTDAIHSLAVSATNTDELQQDNEEQKQLPVFVTILKGIIATFLENQGLTEAQFDEILGVNSLKNTQSPNKKLTSSTTKKTSTNISSDHPQPESSSSSSNSVTAQLGFSSRLFGGGTKGAFRQIVSEAASGISNIFMKNGNNNTSLSDGNNAMESSSSTTEDSPTTTTTKTTSVTSAAGPFSGSWELCEIDIESESKLERIREELGEPWLLRKMLGNMEKSFSIEQDEKECRVRLRKKLFSSGLMTLVLDGEERPWGMSLPLFQGLTKNWKYRAWYDEDRTEINHIHEVSDSGRIVRRLSLNTPMNTMLTIFAAFEQWNGEDWIRKLETKQIARRVLLLERNTSNNDMILDGLDGFTLSSSTPRSVLSNDDFFLMGMTSSNVVVNTTSTAGQFGSSSNSNSNGGSGSATDVKDDELVPLPVVTSSSSTEFFDE